MSENEISNQIETLSVQLDREHEISNQIENQSFQAISENGINSLQVDQSETEHQPNLTQILQDCSLTTPSLSNTVNLEDYLEL